MTAPEHSPLPWKMRKALRPVDGAYDYAISAVIDGHEYCICEVFARVATTVFPAAEANARLIVTAVNAHAELLAAAQRAAGICLKSPRRIDDFDYILTVLRAAIAKAEEPEA